MTGEKLKQIYKGHEIIKLSVAGLKSTLECSLKDYSPYLKKADKDISLYNIFMGKTFSPVKKILIVGNQGIGKTTLTNSILYNWASETLWNDKFAAVYKADLQLLLNDNWIEKYDEYDIDDPKVMLQCLIHSSICESLSIEQRNVANVQLEDIALSNESKILLILDGYDDEVKELEECKDLSVVVSQWENVIVTADPKSITGQDEKKYDTKIEHLGISDTGINEYKKSYFLNNSFSSSSFDTFLNKNEWAKDLCRIPVNLFIFCYLYKDGSSLECKTVSEVYSFFIKKLSNFYIQENWLGFEERGQLFVASLGRLLAYSSYKVNDDPIKGMISREDRSGLSIQSHINYLSDRQLISTNSAGIISLQKICQYGLLQMHDPKNAQSRVLETELQKLNFVFNPLILREYLSSCNIISTLLGDDLKAKKDIIKLINTQKYNESYLTQLKYVSGILGIIGADREISEFLIKVNIIKNSDNINNALLIFWQEITENLYKDYQSEDTYQRAIMLMTLLGQLQSDQFIDANIRNSGKLVDFIDVIMLFHFLNSFVFETDITTSKWLITLKPANYLSFRMKEFILAGLNGDLNLLYNKFNSMQVHPELSGCLAHFKQKLIKSSETKLPVEEVANKIKLSCFQVINNNWNRFESESFSGVLSNIFSQLGEQGEKEENGEKGEDLNWSLIRAAMSCKIKTNDSSVEKADYCVAVILNQPHISDLEIKFIGLISGSRIFVNKGTSIKLNSKSIVSYLIPKSNTAYSDIAIQYVLHFLNNVNIEGELWEDVIDGLCKYYFDESAYVRLSAIKSSVALVLQSKYKEFYENIIGKLLKLISDSSEGVKILVMDSLFNVMGASDDSNLIEDCLPKVMRSISDSNALVRSAIVVGVSDLMVSSIGKDFAQALIEDNISKLIKLLPDQSDNVKVSVIDGITNVLVASIDKDFAEDLIKDNISRLIKLLPDQSDDVKVSVIDGITNVLVASIDKDFAQALIEDNISKLIKLLPDQSDDVKVSVIDGITNVLVASIDKDFAEDLIKDNISRLIKLLPDQSDDVKVSVIDGITNMLVALIDKDFAEALIEDNISRLIKLLPDQSDDVKVSVIDGITNMLVALIDKDFAEDLIKDNILKLINYISNEKVYLSTVIIKSVTTIATQILLFVPKAQDVSKEQDMLEILDEILKIWSKYLSDNNEDLRLSAIDSATEIIVKLGISTKDLDITSRYEKVLNILCNCTSSENIGVRLSAIDGIVGMSAVLEKSDTLTEKLLAQLIRCFSNQNVSVALSAISGACAIGACLLSKWNTAKSGENNNADYVLDKLLPEVTKCWFNKNIDPIPVQRGLVKMLCSSNNALDTMDILHEYFGNKNVRVALSAIETSTEIVLNLFLVETAKSLLASLLDCFDNPDHNIAGTAMKSATDIALMHKELARYLLSSLQSYFDNNKPDIMLLALKVSSEIVIKLKDKDLAKNLLISLSAYYYDDNVSIRSNVSQAINEILNSFSNDPELKKRIPNIDYPKS